MKTSLAVLFTLSSLAKSISIPSPTQGALVAPITYADQTYFIQLQVGSQKKNITAILDTGSADLWVASDYFDYEDSSTFQYNNSDFNMTYAGGNVVSGIWGSDTVYLNGINAEAVVKNQTIGVDEVNQSGAGLIGLGFFGEESSEYPYVNFPQSLVDQGITGRNLYSIYGNQDSVGNIIFGGYREGLYEASSLTKLMMTPYRSDYEVLPNGGSVYRLDTFTISGINISNTENTIVISDQRVINIFDTGSPNTYFSPLMFQNTVVAANLYVDDSGTSWVDKSQYQTMNFTYDLTGAKFTVPFSIFVYQNDTKYEQVINGTTYVATRLQANDTPFWGKDLLKIFYFIIDLENHQFTIGNKITNPGFTKLVAVNDDINVPGTSAISYSEIFTTTYSSLAEPTVTNCLFSISTGSVNSTTTADISSYSTLSSTLTSTLVSSPISTSAPSYCRNKRQ